LASSGATDDRDEAAVAARCGAALRPATPLLPRLVTPAAVALVFFFMNVPRV
jgi:hypothetical protein